MRKPILAAFSGGVDSSLAVAMTLASGGEVIAATLRVVDGPGSESFEARAAAAAAQLGVPHHFLDVRKEFRDVVLRYAWDTYRQGRAPNPCAFCNPYLKFAKLLAFADRVGAETLITGHYARLERDAGGRPFLRRGADRVKDQSYFLAFLKEAALRRVAFPLGDMTKAQTRAEAVARGLFSAKAEESQDVCAAAGEKNFPEFLCRLFGDAPAQARVLDRNGKKLGVCQGVHRYTIGQRKGLGVALGEPAFVTAISAEQNAVVISADPKDLESLRVETEGFQWSPAFGVPSGKVRCLAQARYRSVAAPATAEPLGDDKVLVCFDAPCRAVAPGQVMALYDGETLLGGGWITRAFRDPL